MSTRGQHNVGMRRVWGVVALLALAGEVCGQSGSRPVDAAPVQSTPVETKPAEIKLEERRPGSFLTKLGSLELAGAAAVDFDFASKRLIVSVGEDAALVNLTDPKKPEGLSRLKVFDGGMLSKGVVTAVAADPSRRGVAAVSVVGVARAAANSQVVFVNTATGEVLTRAPVGFDTQDLFWVAHGGLLLTADAGAPMVTEDGRAVDNPGGLSIFSLRKFSKAADFKTMGSMDVNTLLCDGSAYNAASQKEVEQGGLRMRARLVEAKKGYFDIEPRSLFVLGDNVYVACPANNAVAVFSLPTRNWTRYVGMGAMPVVIDGNDQDGVKVLSKIDALPMPGAVVAWDEKDAVRVLAAGSGWGRGVTGPLADEVTIGELAREGRLTDKASKSVDVSESGLGRLRVSKVDGMAASDDDGPKKVGRPLALGSRNFIAMNAPSYDVVGTSGNELETALGKASPEWYNRASAEGKADELSVQRGPQVRKMVLANESGGVRAIAMIERPAAVVAVDFASQAAPRIVGVDVGGPDGKVRMTGMCYIPSHRSPDGKPLLVVSYAEPGEVVVYRVSEEIFKGGAAGKTEEAAKDGSPNAIKTSSPEAKPADTDSGVEKK